ncbi:Uncharacterized protein FWK35_00015049 [Aphis craccivora]|uniref:Uncharacterized protein n=1 Tax=Aphis craccivora TaxID=307492 RepID=A0A6G0YIN9_APHCR|nr:Uncharacterized protein FWK35_00015049 [Aphis craccivora]
MNCLHKNGEYNHSMVKIKQNNILFAETKIVATLFITSRNNASISNFEDSFRWQSEYPWCKWSKEFVQQFSKKSRKTKKKRRKNRNFYKISPYVSINKFWVSKKLENLIQDWRFLYYLRVENFGLQ